MRDLAADVEVQQLEAVEEALLAQGLDDADDLAPMRGRTPVRRLASSTVCSSVAFSMTTIAVIPSLLASSAVSTYSSSL